MGPGPCFQSDYQTKYRTCWWSCYLKSEWSARWVLCYGHHRHVAPLHGEPVREGEHRDGGAVGPARVQLKSINRWVCALFAARWQDDRSIMTRVSILSFILKVFLSRSEKDQLCLLARKKSNMHIEKSDLKSKLAINVVNRRHGKIVILTKINN